LTTPMQYLITVWLKIMMRIVYIHLKIFLQ
jgi:hypothetical protein